MDDDELDFSLPGVKRIEDEEDDELSFKMPDRAPAKEQSWDEKLLDGLTAFGDGLGVSSTGEIAGALSEAGAAMGWIPEMEGGYVRPYEAMTQRLNQEHPIANAAGRATNGAVLGGASAALGAGPLATAGVEASAGLVSGMGDTGDPLDSLLQAGTAGATAYTLGGLTSGRARQGPALERMLTRGDPVAKTAIDEVAGGNAIRGTAGQGWDRVTERARQLGGGDIDAKALPGRANEALRAAQQSPSAQAISRDKLGNYINAAARDPKGAGWESNGVLSPYARQRDRFLAQNPGDEEMLNQLAADSVLSRAQAPQGKGFIDSLAFGRGQSIPQNALRYGIEHLDKMSMSPTAQRGLRAGAGAASSLAGAAVPEMFGASAAEAQDSDSYLNMESRSADQTPAKEPDLRGDKASLNWSVQSALSAGKTGLPQQDEERLTRAIVEGNDDDIATMNFQFQLKYPAYQQAIESRLRGLNGER